MYLLTKTNVFIPSSPRAVGAFVLGMVLMLGACSSTPSEPEPDVVSVTIDGPRIFLFETNDTVALEATARNEVKGPVPAVTDFTWASLTPDLATVDQNGTVTALKRGKAVITATAEGITGEIELDILVEYMLPFPAGERYFVVQSWNGSFSHSSDQNRYAVDFRMDIGTQITAARPGTVAFVRDHFPDGTFTAGEENIVLVQHAHGTFAIYSHLTTGGAQVSAGQQVAVGDPIGLSGNSGFSASPHLHFHVATCGQVGCPSVPIYFRNTDANYPDGLADDTWYEAQTLP